MRGPKRKCYGTAALVDGKWKIWLECGHDVVRPVKHRRTPHFAGEFSTQSSNDPAPQWVYCEKCAEEA